MDGRTRYNKIKQLLKPVVGQELPLHKLQRRVMIEIGTSQSVIEETIRLMIDLGLIHETKHLVFKVVNNEADI